MSEFLAYRIPDQAIKKMSGQFELIDQENTQELLHFVQFQSE